MPNLKVGQSYPATLMGSDGSTPTVTTSTINSGGIVQVTHVGNVATVKAISPGGANITYSSPGYTNATESVVVSALPTLVISDGPVT